MKNGANDDIRLLEKIASFEAQLQKLKRENSHLKQSISHEKTAYTTVLNQQKAATFIQREREKYLALLLANSPSIIIFLSQKLRIEFCTDYFVKKAGYSQPADVLGRAIADILSPFLDISDREELNYHIATAIQTNSPSYFYITLSFKKHSTVEYYDCVAVPMVDEEHKNSGIMLMFHDVTELNDSREAALAASRAKSSFLSKMSHEIRTPLNATIGMANLILREDITPSIAEKVATIKNSGNHLLAIINDILDFSKIESNKLEIIKTAYLLHSVINDIVSTVNSLNKNPNVTFTAYMENEFPIKLFGDAFRLRQVLINILSNAIKYTEEGFVKMNVTWEEVDPKTVLLNIRVVDSGIGISPEDIKTLFDEFTQFSLERNRSTDGTGLGLAISNNLIKLMGGEIKVESTYGVGSVFTVLLPQEFEYVLQSDHSEYSFLETSEEIHEGSVRVTGRIDAETQMEDLSSRFVAPEAKILVVDDVEINLMVAEGLLELYRSQVDLCDSGKEAIEAIKSKDYDLVFMDHMMPEMDGIETVEIIRKLESPDRKYRRLPIIALTANALVGAREMFLENGFNDFLAKPIETDKLHTAMAKWIPRDKQHVIENMPETRETEEIPEELVLDNVNISKGVSYSGGSVKSYLNTLSVFQRDGRSKIANLMSALENEDLKLYAVYVHAFKAACANIGADKLSDEAKILEISSLKQDRKFIAANNDGFIRNITKLLDNIEALISKVTSSSGDDKPLDRNVLNTNLNKLKTALERFDAPSIDEASEALLDFKHDPTVGEALSMILQNAFIGKFKKAVEQIDELL